MEPKLFPKWLCWLMFFLALFNLSAYVTMEVILNKDVELYRYILTFIFGLMFYNMANKKEE